MEANDGTLLLEELHRLVFESSPDAILCIDDHARVRQANLAARELPWSAVANSLLARWTRDPEVIAFRAELRARGRASLELFLEVLGVTWHLAIDGRAFGRDHVLFLREGQPRDGEGTTDDKSRMDSVAAAVAHDFANIVTPMVQIANLLAREVPEGSTAADLVHELILASQCATDLMRQLISFLRRDSSRLDELEVSAVVGNMGALLERLVGDEIELVLDLDPLVGATTANRVQLERVVLNLVANARDAMPSGGKLTLRTHLLLADEERAARMRCPRRGEYVVLTVTDEGTGIPEHVRDHLFEPFFTTKSDGRGTGLGLANARRFANQLGGCIEVRTEVGEGTTVSIYLPRVTQADASPSPSNGSVAASSF